MTSRNHDEAPPEEHWAGVYAGKAPDLVSWYQAVPAVSLDLIAKAAPARHTPIIDVGGGASTLVDHLLERGYGDVSVLDIAPAALDAARARLGALASRVAWIVADITRWTPPRAYGVWHDRAVFHFLTGAADRRAYLNALAGGLADDGVALFATFGPDGPEKCSGLPVERYDAAKLASVLGEGFRVEAAADEVHVTPGGMRQAFRYFEVRCR
jgi:SAM-dependent methyltransferase